MAELLAIHVTRQLACEYESLVVRKLCRDIADAPQVMAQDREPLYVGARVGDLNSTTLAIDDRQRIRDRCFDRAAPAERTATIMHTREQALLERIGDVGTARERFPALGSGQ
jgi:hypothetical protein